ncbi:hypothetical protein GJ496_003809 [Pomphorhynchus laevis]|nr:hypothetical protein GJ496_003809 [Pomphorhynchus laevis]
MEKENLRPAGEKRKSLIASPFNKRRAVSQIIRGKSPLEISVNLATNIKHLFDQYRVPLPGENNNAKNTFYKSINRVEVFYIELIYR